MGPGCGKVVILTLQELWGGGRPVSPEPSGIGSVSSKFMPTWSLMLSPCLEEESLQK